MVKGDSQKMKWKKYYCCNFFTQ